jgi:hypothetical protein
MAGESACPTTQNRPSRAIVGQAFSLSAAFVRSRLDGEGNETGGLWKE